MTGAGPTGIPLGTGAAGCVGVDQLPRRENARTDVAGFARVDQIVQRLARLEDRSVRTHSGRSPINTAIGSSWLTGRNHETALPGAEP